MARPLGDMAAKLKGRVEAETHPSRVPKLQDRKVDNLETTVWQPQSPVYTCDDPPPTLVLFRFLFTCRSIRVAHLSQISIVFVAVVVGQENNATRCNKAGGTDILPNIS